MDGLTKEEALTLAKEVANKLDCKVNADLVSIMCAPYYVVRAYLPDGDVQEFWDQERFKAYEIPDEKRPHTERVTQYHQDRIRIMNQMLVTMNQVRKDRLDSNTTDWWNTLCYEIVTRLVRLNVKFAAKRVTI